jgi:hypothetical protein
MDDGNDGARCLCLSAHQCIPLHFFLSCVNQHKVLFASNILITQLERNLASVLEWEV